MMSEMGGVDKVGDLRGASAYTLWRIRTCLVFLPLLKRATTLTATNAREFHSHKRYGLYVWRRAPEKAGECLEVLDDGSEVELVASAGKAPQPHTLKTVVRLQVRKAHLDLLALVT